MDVTCFLRDLLYRSTNREKCSRTFVEGSLETSGLFWYPKFERIFVPPSFLTSVILSRDRFAHANSARPDLKVAHYGKFEPRIPWRLAKFYSIRSEKERERTSQTSLQLRRLRFGVGAWNNSWRISTSLSAALHRLL